MPTRNIHKTEHIICNLCGSNDYQIIFPAKTDVQDLKKRYTSSSTERLTDQTVKCKKCGLIYINPRINHKMIIKGYSEGTDEKFVSEAKFRELTFKRQLKEIDRFMPKKGKILDVGTAGGSFLHMAKEDGWDVYGVEPKKWLCDWCKKNYGIDIKPGTLDDVNFSNNYFDVVTLWDVLEHVPDPTETMLSLKRILKPGGLLVINYPDIGSWIAKVMGHNWVFLVNVHLFYFNRKTIKKLLEKTGFEILVIKPHIQTLSLGYLAGRLNEYYPSLCKIVKTVVTTFKLDNVPIPYWLGQTLVIAKRI